MKQYDLLGFIEDLLIPDLKKMLEHQLHYYAFAIICQGVEIMGASLDNEELTKNGESETRFKNGLTHFFRNPKYAANQSLFFSFLRGPLIHQLRPGESFLLASTKKDNVKPEAHFTKQESGLILLLIELFLEDFIDAFSRFKRKLEERRGPSPTRFTNPFLCISELPPDLGKSQWDKNLRVPLALTPYATGSANPSPTVRESAVD